MKYVAVRIRVRHCGIGHMEQIATRCIDVDGSITLSSIHTAADRAAVIGGVRILAVQLSVTRMMVWVNSDMRI